MSEKRLSGKPKLSIHDRLYLPNLGKKYQKLITVVSIALVGLTACSLQINSQAIIPTVQAAREQDLKTNFVPTGEFTQQMFDDVAPFIFEFATKDNPKSRGFVACTISLIDDKDDSNADYYVTADHCLKNSQDILDLISPWKNSVYGSEDYTSIREIPIDQALIILPNRKNIYPNNYLNPDGEFYDGKGIPFHNKPLQLGQNVLVAGYPVDSATGRVVGGEDHDLLSMRDSDAILITAIGKITRLPDPAGSDYIHVEYSNYNFTSYGHSGSIMFVVEDNRLVAGGVLSGGSQYTVNGNSFDLFSSAELLNQYIESYQSANNK